MCGAALFLFRIAFKLQVVLAHICILPVDIMLTDFARKHIAWHIEINLETVLFCIKWHVTDFVGISDRHLDMLFVKWCTGSPTY